jgi:hypothetical protein
LLFCAALTFCCAHARADVAGTGTTAATFVKLGTGARAIAMGEAYTAVGSDTDDLSYNPAGIQSSLSTLELTHNSWFEGAFAETLAGIANFGPSGTLGANLNYLSIPNQQLTDLVGQTGNPQNDFLVIGSFSPYDAYGTVSYANTWGEHFTYGASFKASGQSINSQLGVGIGVDLGGMYQLPIDGLVLGAAVQNLGLPVQLLTDKFDLPEIARLGASYKAFKKKLLVSADFDLPNDAADVFAVGLEYDVQGSFFPRIGYRLDGIYNPWSAGFGAKFGSINLDFATVPYGPLGQTYRFSIGYTFGLKETGTAEVIAAPVERKVVLPEQDGKFMITDQETFLALKPTVTDNAHVTAWSVAVFDGSRRIVKHYGVQGQVPEEIQWNGYFDSGQKATQGYYWCILTVRYADGKVQYSNYVKLTISNFSQ